MYARIINNKNEHPLSTIQLKSKNTILVKPLGTVPYYIPLIIPK